MISENHRTLSLQATTAKGALFQGDCLNLLSRIRTASIDCIFADPPFNLGKDYGTQIADRLPEAEYLTWTQSWLNACVRVLKPGGSLFIYHIPRWLIQVSSYLNTLDSMEFRNWIAIKMKNGFPQGRNLHPAHYGLLYYTKRGKPAKFHIVRTPSPTCRHCGKLLRDYGGYHKKYKKDGQGRPLIRLADFWEDISPNIHRKSRPKTVNELPLDIPQRAIGMSTNRGDIVLDPFAGGGGTLYSAEMLGRYWIGCEIGPTNTAIEQIMTKAKLISPHSVPQKLIRAMGSDHSQMTLE